MKFKKNNEIKLRGIINLLHVTEDCYKEFNSWICEIVFVLLILITHLTWFSPLQSFLEL